MKGKFIVFEGLDCSGKTTHMHALADSLKAAGYNVVTCHEPGTTSTGIAVRKALQNNMTAEAELLLFYAARAELVESVILPAIEAGKIVLCDRFIMSTQAYQGFGRGIDYRKINGLHAQFAHSLFPDYTIYMNIPPEESATRSKRSGRTDRMNCQPVEFYKSVEQGYIFELQRLLSSIRESYFIVNGMLPQWEVAQLIKERVVRFLDEGI